MYMSLIGKMNVCIPILFYLTFVLACMTQCVENNPKHPGQNLTDVTLGLFNMND